MSTLVLVGEQNTDLSTVQCKYFYGKVSKDMWSPGLLLRAKCYGWIRTHKVRNTIHSHTQRIDMSFSKGSLPTVNLCYKYSKESGLRYVVNVVIRFDAVSRLKHLHSSGWLGRETVALKVQFTLYSPAPNLFTSVALLTEQSPTGGLLPSSKVQSVRVYHTPAVWDYVAMIWQVKCFTHGKWPVRSNIIQPLRGSLRWIFLHWRYLMFSLPPLQLLFLLLSLLQLCHQVYIVRQQGLMGYCRRRYNWLEVSLYAYSEDKMIKITDTYNTQAITHQCNKDHDDLADRVTCSS